MPSFCPNFKSVEENFDEQEDKRDVKESLVKLLDQKDESSKHLKAEYRMQLAFWLAAWDGYALAAAVLEQVCFCFDLMVCRSLHEFVRR